MMMIIRVHLLIIMEGKIVTPLRRNPITEVVEEIEVAVVVDLTAENPLQNK